jgi:hypothetical protein
MRTAIALTVLAGFVVFSTPPAIAETIPTNSGGVFLTNFSINSLVTNVSASGTNLLVTNTVIAPVRLRLPAYENTEVVSVLTLDARNTNNPAWTTNSSTAFTNTPASDSLVGYDWTTSLPTITNGTLVKLVMGPIDTNKLLTSIAMNRLAYGPTPYELAQVLGTNSDGIIGGPGASGATKTIDQWITEQIEPWNLTEDVDSQFNVPLIGLPAISNRFGTRLTVILSNTVITNIVESPPTVFTTNLVANTETNGPGTAGFNDFRAWYAMRAVGARRQLFEVLLHFMENHFVSQWSKDRDATTGQFNGQNSDAKDRIPTAFTIQEHLRYRTALIDPNVTWLDLLKLQHQSESMTIFLDTATSVASGNIVANENYAREIMELFCMGVDNGYDQRDITAMSMAWSGWDVNKVAEADAGNIFAATLAGNVRLNRGLYLLNFVSGNHGNSNLYIWYNTTNGLRGVNPGTPPVLVTNEDLSVSSTGFYPNGPVIPGTAGLKKVDPRFNGSGMTPSHNYAAALYGTNTVPGSYALFIPQSQSGGNANNNFRTNKVYTIMTNMANLPYSQEFISVKLCQLLVHDNFQIGYNFSDGTVTPEEQLVWDCMRTWDTTTPKGKLWPVIKTITDSKLFRSTAAAGTKVKTPLEYAISAIRANRAPIGGSFTPGNFTADTIGYLLVSGGTNNLLGLSTATSTTFPLDRMGNYRIFDRDAPDGYPETGTVYVGPGGLTERSRWLDVLLDETQADGLGASTGPIRATFANPVTLLQEYVPVAKRLDADAVARFFTAIYFPGEGGANLDYYRRRAIDLLNTSEAGVYAAGSFSAQTVGAPEYNYRVRRMVSTLMTMPRFHEQ